MHELKIKQEFRDLIPPLADHEKEGLEEDIKHFGCYCPIVTWQGYIIDGHHRYEICMRHKLSFRVEEREFDDEIATKRWIIGHQFSRRNLPIEERLRLAFADTDLEALQAEAKKRSAKNNRYMQSTEKESINESPLADTRKEGRSLEKIAKKAGCGRQTAYEYKKVKDAGQLDRLKKGESIKKVAGDIQRVEKRNHKEATLKATEFPKDRYRVIYADPPWEYGPSKGPGGGDAEDEYPTMSFDSICELPVSQIADEKAVLFLWATTPLLLKTSA